MPSNASFHYYRMPEGFDRKPKSGLTQQFWLSRRAGRLALPRASLHIADDDGTVLRYAACARRQDFRLRVAVTREPVLVDLYAYYLIWVNLGGWGTYRVMEQACHTFVKFGQCEQHRRSLLVTIRPAQRCKESP